MAAALTIVDIKRGLATAYDGQHQWFLTNHRYFLQHINRQRIVILLTLTLPAVPEKIKISL